jgi:DNA-directed RNA polymerase subunit M/transcription elongation factor TFIIS
MVRVRIKAFSGVVRRMRCPRCGGELRRWAEGDEREGDAYWVACRCESCGYVVRIKHVD